MLHDNSVGQLQEWQDVGFHPTPTSIVRFFASQVADQVCKCFPEGASVSVLDACAGDGRLGHAVARRLVRQGRKVHVTFVESSWERASKIRLTRTYSTDVVVADFFDLNRTLDADVVVSNPPYLALSRETSSAFSISWSRALEGGRNLYGLALLRCIDSCAAGGVVGFLAPHGWLNNRSSNQLRERVSSQVESVFVHASSSRRLFPDVNQDIALQILLKRSQVSGKRVSTSATITYDGGSRKRIGLLKRVPISLGLAVRIGSLVWNRQKELLTKSPAGLPLIYGGNIGVNNVLKFPHSRYQSRQFVRRSRVPSSYVHKGPCILIKRSLRGGPGNWQMDFAVVIKREFEFVAENHVIVIALEPSVSSVDALSIAKAIKRKVERAHRHHGHPNISVMLLRDVLSEQGQ